LPPATSGVFSKTAERQPQRRRDGLQAQPADPAACQQQVEAVCAGSHQAPERRARAPLHTRSVDELTGIQAVERIARTQPMQPGQAERRAVEDQRHGTPCLIGTVEGATGAVRAPTVPQPRTAADCVRPIAAAVATDPEAGWIVSADNLTIQGSASLVCYVAAACGMEEDRGKQGKRGVLRPVATRTAFVREPSQRLRLVYVPKLTSWLKRIESWFSILVRRVIKRGHVTSVSDLREKSLAGRGYVKETLAKPFQWTFTGRPLNVGTAKQGPAR
jgi:hypothetical protein